MNNYFTLPINLLPWRAELYEKNKRWFIRWISLLIITIICLLFVGREMVIFLLAQKKLQIAELQQQLVTLEPDIKKNLQIDQQKKQLNQIQRLVNEWTQQELKTNNFLDFIEQSVPNGMKIKIIKQQENQWNIVGYSQQHQQITLLILALEKKHFKQPSLRQIKAVSTVPNYPYEFELVFNC